MQVILMEKIENLGNLGDVVNVKSGFARNFLVPQGKAKTATKENIEHFEQIRVELEKTAKDALTAAQARAKEIEGTVLELEVRAGPEGKLFGSVSNQEIADQLTAKGMNVEKREVRMPDGPIRSLGEYEISIHLHTDVDATVKVVVAADADSIVEVEETGPIGTFVDDED